MLQTVANDLNILEIPYRMQLEKQMWNKEFPLIRDSSKCIKCMRCIQVCDKVQLSLIHICGKCVPCRIGLGQLNGFIKDVLDGNATMETLDIMEQTALSIMESADCAIGYEAVSYTHLDVYKRQQIVCKRKILLRYP